LNFYKHHLGDYSKATAHLSIIEHGAYLLMLHHHYATEAPLPASEAVICRIIRATSKAEAEAVHQVLTEFWTLTPEGWINDRAADEIEAASELRDLNTEKGKLGGRPKKADGKAEENPPAFSRVSSGKAEQKPSQTPDTRLQTPRGINPPNPPAAAPPSVELPPGLLPETWKAFRDHRQRLRAPLTPRAEKLLLTKLAGLCGDGSDPNTLVDRSIEHGWKGLFPLNGSRGDASEGIRQWLERSTVLEGEFSHDA
jgi:uncharacterized protein YdaU (DUF1376 family)